MFEKLTNLLKINDSKINTDKQETNLNVLDLEKELEKEALFVLDIVESQNEPEREKLRKDKGSPLKLTINNESVIVNFLPELWVETDRIAVVRNPKTNEVYSSYKRRFLSYYLTEGYPQCGNIEVKKERYISSKSYKEEFLRDLQTQNFVKINNEMVNVNTIQKYELE